MAQPKNKDRTLNEPQTRKDPPLIIKQSGLVIWPRAFHPQMALPPPPDLYRICPVCESVTEDIKCKRICPNCHAIVQSCCD